MLNRPGAVIPPELGVDSTTVDLLQGLFRAFHLDSAFVIAAVEETQPLMEPMSWEELRAVLGTCLRKRAADPLRRVPIGWVWEPKYNPSLAFARGFESAAWTRLALTVSALNAYRAARGRYPDRLEALVPAFAPLDTL